MSQNRSTKFSDPANVKKSQKLLFTTFNCAKSQVIPMMDSQRIKDDSLIMALTGLAGGMVNNGSTCGVVIGSGISLAMLRDKELAGKWTDWDVVQLLKEIKEHVNWFEGKYGTSLCRERPELTHEKITVLGLLNPIKAKGCVSRASASMDRLSQTPRKQDDLINAHEKTGEVLWCEHCAANVLAKIRQETGIGSLFLERVSIALDGGIGLNGGGCGALAGGIMALGLAFALDTSQLDPTQLRNVFRSMDAMFFRKASQLTNGFIDQFQFLECSRLTGKNFADWEEFRTHRSSNACDQINTFVSDTTIQIIQNAGMG